MRKPVFSTCVAGYDLQIIPEGKKKFTVVYGKKITKGLHWLDAAHKFGECLFHGLECTAMIER